MKDSRLIAFAKERRMQIYKRLNGKFPKELIHEIFSNLEGDILLGFDNSNARLKRLGQEVYDKRIEALNEQGFHELWANSKDREKKRIIRSVFRMKKADALWAEKYAHILRYLEIALQLAIELNDTETVNAFINAPGFDVNAPIGHSGAKISFDLCPLHCAVLAKQENIFIMLLQHGADIHKKDSSDNTPLTYAIIHKLDNIFNYMKQHQSKELTIDQLWHPLLMAVGFHASQVVFDYLLKSQAMDDMTNDYFSQIMCGIDFEYAMNRLLSIKHLRTLVLENPKDYEPKIVNTAQKLNVEASAKINVKIP